jgi:hypothetical protein
LAGLDRLGGGVRVQPAASRPSSTISTCAPTATRVSQGAGLVHAAGRQPLAPARLGSGREPARDRRVFDPPTSHGFEAFETEALRLGASLFDAFERDDVENVRFDDETRATLAGSAAELVERYVATPVLQATLATDGLIGTYAGPFEAGTGTCSPTTTRAVRSVRRARGASCAAAWAAVSRAIALAARSAAVRSWSAARSRASS